MHDLDTTPDPDDRDAALERGFTLHDTLQFRGKALRPLTLSSWRLLIQSENKLLTGGTKDPVGDAAAYMLIHVRDEDEHRNVRATIWRGMAAWNEYIHQYLDENPDILGDLTEAIPMVKKMLADFHAAQTKSVSASEHKKKSGVLLS